MKTFAKRILALTLTLPTLSFAASLDSLSTSITSNKQQSIAIKTDTTKITSKYDECYRLDKITGQLVPCETKSGSGTTYDRGDTDNDSPYTHLAFNYFDSDYNEADFYNDPESVITNAYLLSQLSAIAYPMPGPDDNAMASSTESIEDIAERTYALAENLGLSSLPVIHESEVNILDLDFGDTAGESTAYVFYNDYAVFIAFQGSTGGSDWLESNIDFWPYAKPEWGHTKNVRCFIYCFTYYTDVVTIHNGFYEAMDIIFAQVLDAVEPLVEEGRKLWITGHSLGGAVAVLSAFQLQFDYGIDVQGVHVFGAPAVGDSDWYNVFESKMSNVHRWGVEGDPAPVITQAPMFYHVGFINNLYTNGDYLLNGDNSDMFGYLPHCNPTYGFLVRHMSYWPRMHDLFVDHNPYLASLLPESLPGVDGDCE